MRRLIYISLLLILCTACHRNKPTLYGTETVQNKELIEGINRHVDSLDALLPSSVLQQSLIFSRDNYSFYVSRYVLKDRVNLYVETGIRNNNALSEKRYYLKDGKILLYVLNVDDLEQDEDEHYQKTYFADGKIIANQGAYRSGNQGNLFEQEQMRSASDIQADLRELKDAIYQEGNFDLRVEAVADYPRATYLILSSRNINSYRSALKVDPAGSDLQGPIAAILASPADYKGRKLDLKWEIRKPFETVFIDAEFDRRF